jgi:DNA polymerase-4
MARLIAHLDMNSFFVSCERLADPSLEGKILVVGGRKGERGVVCSASYEARKYGIHAGMPLRTADKLCPKATFVPGQHRLYSKYSRRVYALLRRLSPVVEYASIDEFYLDLTGCEALYGGDVAVMAAKIRQAVFERTKLQCTVAIASNKYVAKIAGKTVKPDSVYTKTKSFDVGGTQGGCSPCEDGVKVVRITPGTVVVPEGTEEAFLAPLAITRLHGLGEKTLPRVKALGIECIGDFRKFTKVQLERSFGPASAEWFYDACRGIDDSEVVETHEAKSVGNETTFDKDTADQAEIARTISWLSEKSCYRLRRIAKKARTVTLKLRFDDFETLTRARATNDDAAVVKTAMELFKESYKRGRKVRLLGVTLSKFDEAGEEVGWLFREMDDSKKTALLKSVDVVKRRYGFHKLEKAASLDAKGPRPGGGPSSFEKPKTQ